MSKSQRGEVFGDTIKEGNHEKTTQDLGDNAENRKKDYIDMITSINNIDTHDEKSINMLNMENYLVKQKE